MRIKGLAYACINDNYNGRKLFEVLRTKQRVSTCDASKPPRFNKAFHSPVQKWKGAASV